MYRDKDPNDKYGGVKSDSTANLDKFGELKKVAQAGNGPAVRALVVQYPHRHVAHMGTYIHTYIQEI